MTDQSFPKDFALLLERHAARPAIREASSGELISYAQLDAMTARLGARLAAEGVRTGDRIATLLPGRRAAALTFLSCFRHGIDIMPLFPQSTLPEQQRYFRIVRPRFLVVEEGAIPPGAEVLAAQGQDVAARLIVLKPADLAVSGAAAAPPARELPASNLFIATSGSTGASKVIQVDRDRIWTAACVFSRLHSFLDDGAVFYNFFSMSYMAGLFNLLLVPFSVGASVVLGEEFNAVSLMKLWPTVKKHGINTLWFSPTVLHNLAALNRKSRQLCEPELARTIRAGFLGMGPISLKQKAEYEERLGVPVVEDYRLSELTFVTTETLESRARRVEGSMGELLPGVDARQKPETGELEIRTPFLCVAELTEENGQVKTRSFDRTQFWATGDVAEVRDRQLIYRSRIKNIVKKGGYLVSLDEIERCLSYVDGISRSLVVGIEHPFYGETIAICMLEAEREAATRAREHLSRELSRFKWPSFFAFVAEMPLTLSGKPDRKRIEKLVAEMATGNGLEAF